MDTPPAPPPAMPRVNRRIHMLHGERISIHMLHGERIVVVADSAEQLAAVGAVLAGFDQIVRVPATGGGGMTLRVWNRPDAVPLPRGACSAEQDGIRAWTTSSSVILACEGHRAHVDPAGGVADLAVQPRAHMRNDFVMDVLVLLLRRRGLPALHASAVARGGAGTLFVGPCGSSKSTQTYALVHQGWQYLGDDALLLRRGARAVEALPLRRYLHLDDGALRRCGGVDAAALALARNGKRRLIPAEGRDRAIIDSTVPRLLVFPRIVGSGASQLVEIGKAEALRRLFGQTIVMWLDCGALRGTVSLLGSLVGQVRSFCLLAGTDLKDRPQRVAALLSEVATGPETGE